MTSLIDIRVPDIGDFQDVAVIEISLEPGANVDAEDTIMVVESDKATMDVPVGETGTLTEILVNEGDTVSEGTLLARVTVDSSQTTGNDTKPLAPIEAVEYPSSLVSKESVDTMATATDRESPSRTLPAPTVNSILAHASPSIRKYARTLGVDIHEVVGSGTKGRITQQDVEAYVKGKLEDKVEEATPTDIGLARLPEWPSIDFEKFGAIKREKLTRIRRISGPSLTRNSIVIPHVCNFDKADVTELEAFRKQLNQERSPENEKVTMLAFTVLAVVSALKTYPYFNSSLVGDEIILKKYWNMAVAADTPEGLVVPVVKNADQKGVREIATEMQALAAKARSGKLAPTDMSGATFTISSLGGVGGTGFTPIINAPEVAILGMARAELTPVYVNGELTPRLIQPLSLSWDHRVVDGVVAARFLQHVSQILSDFRLASV